MTVRLASSQGADNILNGTVGTVRQNELETGRAVS